MQEEAAQLERLEIHGEKDELKKTETKSKSIKPYTEYFEAEEGFFSNLKKGGVPKTAVSVHTYFDVVDPETRVKARSIMKKIIDEAKHEGAGCIYFGWHRDGRKMVLRGTFHDAQAASNHFKVSTRTLSPFCILKQIICLQPIAPNHECVISCSFTAFERKSSH